MFEKTSPAPPSTETECAGLHVTRADIEECIDSEYYINAGDAIANLDSSVRVGGSWRPGMAFHMTICVLQLKNGFVVIGDAGPADPLAFDPVTGRNAARANAVAKLWPILGFQLRQGLRVHAQASASAVIPRRDYGGCALAY